MKLINHFSAQVVVAGREWLMAWEDGQKGIFKYEGTRTLGVTRVHELINSDSLQLTDNLLERTAEHAQAQLLGHSRHVGNDPNMSRAKSLLCICNNLESAGVLALASPSSSTVAAVATSTSSTPTADTAQAEPEEDGNFFERFMARKPVAVPAAPQSTANGKGNKRKGPPGGSQPAVPKPSVPKPPVPPNTPSRKREQDPNIPAPKRTRASSIESMDPSLLSANTDKMSEADQAWATEFKGKLDLLLQFDPPAGDTEFRQLCNEKTKSLTTLISVFKSRQRSLKRRTTESKAGPLEQAEAMEQVATLMSHFIKGLNKHIAALNGDDCYARLQSLLEAKCSFGQEVYLRVAKALWNENLRFQKWSAMLGSTYDFVKAHVTESEDITHISVLRQQTTVMLQKLLRGIAGDKVAGFVVANLSLFVSHCYQHQPKHVKFYFWMSQVVLDESSDLMQPLRTFVKTMMENFPSKSGDENKEFTTLNCILNATATNPKEVQAALDALKDAGQSNSILLSFKSLCQGKKAISLAEEFVDGQSHLVEFAETLKVIMESCQENCVALDGQTPDAACELFVKVFTQLKDQLGKVDMKDQSAKDTVSKAQAELKAYAQKVVNHEVVYGLCTWLAGQAQTITDSKILSRPPRTALFNFCKDMPKVLGEPLVQLDDLQQFVDATDAASQEVDALLRLPTSNSNVVEMRGVSVKLCTAFMNWQEAKGKLLCSSPVAKVQVEKVEAALGSLVQSTCHNVWKAAVKTPRHVVAGFVKCKYSDTSAPKAQLLIDAIAAASDAKLLTTGLEKPLRDSLEHATVLLENLVMLCQALVEEKPDCASRARNVRLSAQVFNSIGLLDANTSLKSDLPMEKSQIMILASELLSFYFCPQIVS